MILPSLSIETARFCALHVSPFLAAARVRPAVTAMKLALMPYPETSGHKILRFNALMLRCSSLNKRLNEGLKPAFAGGA
jgi:hypothetical protein